MFDAHEWWIDSPQRQEVFLYYTATGSAWAVRWVRGTVLLAVRWPGRVANHSLFM